MTGVLQCTIWGSMRDGLLGDSGKNFTLKPLFRSRPKLLLGGNDIWPSPNKSCWVREWGITQAEYVALMESLQKGEGQREKGKVRRLERKRWRNSPSTEGDSAWRPPHCEKKEDTDIGRWGQGASTSWSPLHFQWGFGISVDWHKPAERWGFETWD